MFVSRECQDKMLVFRERGRVKCLSPERGAR